MKAGIFDPYLDTIGGGERYCLTFAESLLKKGWQVDLFGADKKELEKKFIEKLSLDIEGINYLSYSPRTANMLNRWKVESKYDLLFYFSDGTLPFMFGKNNFLHFQVPFKVSGKTFKNKLKLNFIKKIICNSEFTKKIIDNSYGLNSEVIYPPVDIESIVPNKKGKIILFIGRFSQLLQSKKQDVLVEAFKKMVNGGNKEWKLILAGGSEIGGEEYVEHLKTQINGYPVQIIKNPSFKEVIALYGKAKLFWSASGYGVDELTNPEKVEHFGMSTVESMAAGCIPVVLGKGGQKEIVEQGINGFLWQNEDELIKYTLKLISDKELSEKMSKSAVLRSRLFSKDNFYQKIYEAIEK